MKIQKQPIKPVVCQHAAHGLQMFEVPSNHIHSKPLPQLTEFLPQALCYEFERTQETPNDS